MTLLQPLALPRSEPHITTPFTRKLLSHQLPIMPPQPLPIRQMSLYHMTRITERNPAHPLRILGPRFRMPLAQTKPPMTQVGSSFCIRFDMVRLTT